MGMKAKSSHFSGNKTSGGESRREGMRFKLNIQLFASNKPDSKMSVKGQQLYDNAQNQSLKNQIAELYRPGAKIGDGGTADALRHEIKTGKLVGGKSHYLKAKERVRSLTKLVNSGTLSASDKKIAQDLINDLNDALKGWKK